MLNIEHLTKTLNIEHWGMNITLYTFNIKHQRSIDIKNCPLNNIEQHWTTLNSIGHHWRTLDNVEQHWITLNNIVKQITTLHNIEHRTLNNIEHWTLKFNVEHWTLEIEQWTLNIEHWTLNNEHWTLNNEQWTMNLTTKISQFIAVTLFQLHQLTFSLYTFIQKYSSQKFILKKPWHSNITLIASI